MEVDGLVERVGGHRAGGVERVDGVVIGLEGHPAGMTRGGATAGRVVLGGFQPEVRRLDAQRGVVRHHARRRVHRLTERRADDAVVGHVGVEAVLDEQMLLHAVDLDLQRAVRRGIADAERRGQRSAGADAVLTAAVPLAAAIEVILGRLQDREVPVAQDADAIDAERLNHQIGRQRNLRGHLLETNTPLFDRRIGGDVEVVERAHHLEPGDHAQRTVELAAHGITMEVASLSFMVHLGLSNAATVRAGRAEGAGDARSLRDGAKTAIALSFGIWLARKIGQRMLGRIVAAIVILGAFVGPALTTVTFKAEAAAVTPA